MKRLWTNRLYKSGTIWCLWRWTDVQSEYIVRLHVIKTPWNALCVHWIRKPDPEPFNHDHPVTFLSLFIKGWYEEDRVINGVFEHRCHRWWNWINASRNDAHTITKVSPTGCITLCFMGPKIREWGFHVNPNWVMWKDYYKQVDHFRLQK